MTEGGVVLIADNLNLRRIAIWLRFALAILIKMDSQGLHFSSRKMGAIFFEKGGVVVS